MARIIWVCFALSLSLAASDLLEQRIGRYDEAKWRVDKPTHLGTGELHYQALLSSGAIENLGFMHRGIILPKSGIGHHFHNANEEMFIVWGGDAVFTIDGRSSLLHGPVGAPLRAGHSHAVYNPGNTPLHWMNINFHVTGAAGRGSIGDRGAASGQGRGAVPFSYFTDPTSVVNLGDDRVAAPLDVVPVFQYTTLYRETMRPVSAMNGGHGAVLYQRCLGPSTYTGNWAFIDHYILPPGSSIGRHRHEAVEEIWYVMNGAGTITVDGETAHLGTYDAAPIRVNEVHSFQNDGTRDLEFMVVGAALRKGILDSTDVK
jgi:mannose-6-phosphate isomerase-like protein (cupin superfamily)